jgi:hypothetical protein
VWGRARLLRLGGWAVSCVLIALLAWQVVVELVEPHLLLVFEPRVPFVEAPTVGGTRLRLYGDTRPHVGKISGLQKGLVWVRNGRPLVEEGYGFGAPIVEYQGQAYVARHAEVERSSIPGGVRLIKRYRIDTVDTPIQLLRRKYRPVAPLGSVTVQYDVWPEGLVDVWVDFRELEADWGRVYLMNEQGARRFVRYKDAGGIVLEGPEIGIWESKAEFTGPACMSSKPAEDGFSSLCFCVEPLEEGAAPPVRIYYGRERYKQYNWRGTYHLSWAGIDLEVEAPQPAYGYRISLEAR